MTKVHQSGPTREQGSLHGVTVLDATQMLAGPLAAARLGDLGANVIKIEPVGRGEFNRTHGFGDASIDGEMTTFTAVNRNKRSLAIDLKHPEAHGVLARLVSSADVFIQNFRQGTAEKLGVGFTQLEDLNPALVYCSISGYGSTGPYRDRPGQDLIVQGYSGSMFSVGRDADPPQPGALWAADVMTGYQAAIGILAALHDRHHSGLGQHVEVDMLTVTLDAQLQELVTYLNLGLKPVRTKSPSAHASIPAPYGVYKTSDGWLTLAMSPLPALGEMLDDDVLRSMTAYNDGMIKRDEIWLRIKDRFIEKSTAEWVSLSDEFGVWAGPVYDYDGLQEDPHVSQTGIFTSQPHRVPDNPVKTVRPPIRMSRNSVGISRGAPALGEHTRAVLGEIGFTDEEIRTYLESGVVG